MGFESDVAADSEGSAEKSDCCNYTVTGCAENTTIMAVKAAVNYIVS